MVQDVDKMRVASSVRHRTEGISVAQIRSNHCERVPAAAAVTHFLGLGQEWHPRPRVPVGPELRTRG
jgi:hypothetical protein